MTRITIKKPVNPQHEGSRIMAQSTITELVRRLYPFAYSITSHDGDKALPRFLDELPFKIHEWPAGTEFNGWQVTPAWSVVKAKISRNGRLIWDGMSSPLGVVWLSPSFSGRMELDELKKHLFWSEEHTEATVYHWGALYRPAERNWGFCIPKQRVEQLETGTYEIELVTESDSNATMKVLDYVLPGELADTVVISAHNCHPYQANDDLSGCAVGMRLMQRLAQMPHRRLTYRLVLGPELVGTTLWLDALGDEARRIKCALLLKAIGNDGPLRLQDSFTGKARIDFAAHYAFDLRFDDYESGAFRTIYGNDETVFEAPGFEIPTVSLTRMPFSEYHTDRDTPERLSERCLQETLETATDICVSLENDVAYTAQFKGLVSLSNPRYGLYKHALAPGLSKTEYTDRMKRWNLLMNCLPRYLDGKTTVLDMAARQRLPVAEVREYLDQWAERGLAVRA